MPPLSRPQGVPLGQIGNIQPVTPRIEDSGVGGVLQKAAGMQFAAAQTEVDTGSKMNAQGLQQAAIGEELMKPFKKTRSSTEIMATEDLAVDAVLSMRAKVQAMQSGSQRELWGEGYKQILDETSQEYLSKAAGISEAAHEYVAGEITKERLSGASKLTLDFEKEGVASREATLDKLKDFTFREALAGSPEERLANRKRFTDRVDNMVFNKDITPLKGKQKVDDWDKQLTVETGIQTALLANTESGHRYINNSNMLPTDKIEAINKINDAVSFRVKEKAELSAAADKKLKVDQGAAMTTFQGAIMRESDSGELLKLSFNATRYVEIGLLGPNDGPQLQGLINTKLKELATPVPEQDTIGIADLVLNRILQDPETTTDDMITKQPLTFATKTRLLDKRAEYRSTTHYHKLSSFDHQKRLISALRTVELTNAERVNAQIKGTAQYNYNEAVARALRVHDQLATNLRNKLERPLTDADVFGLDGEVKKIVDGIKAMKWIDTPGSPLESYKK